MVKINFAFFCVFYLYDVYDVIVAHVEIDSVYFGFHGGDQDLCVGIQYSILGHILWKIYGIYW